MRIVGWICVSLCVGLIWAGGCSTTPKGQVAKTALDQDVQNAITLAKQQDPSITRFFDQSTGYAVFPTVGKGAFIVGGAYGQGQLFEHGQMVGYCTVTQASAGLAAGGQAYSELIFLESPDALNRFKYGNIAFSAETSAVALRSGVAATAPFSNGVAVFITSQQGLMAGVSLAGQHFAYEAK
jgi:lipid-binding SYLF domain-containing protein